MKRGKAAALGFAILSNPIVLIILAVLGIFAFYVLLGLVNIPFSFFGIDLVGATTSAFFRLIALVIGSYLLWVLGRNLLEGIFKKTFSVKPLPLAFAFAAIALLINYGLTGHTLPLSAVAEEVKAPTYYTGDFLDGLFGTVVGVVLVLLAEVAISKRKIK